MTKPAFERKLTAIFSADVKGYSILMADNEEATIQTITTYRSIMSGLIEKCQGRVIDSPGDNLLAEFKSAVSAVQCAVEIQNALHKENELLPDKRRMIFRIGINIGDIAQEGNRIYGDGVNRAARIEGISEPGGVCISRNVYDHVKEKLNFGYEYIGEHTVKNISDPVRVYKVLMDTKDAGKRIKIEPNPSVKKSRLKKWLRIMASIILILSAVLAGVYWKYIYLPAPADIDLDNKMEFNLPTGPSIAVLPFVNMSKDPEQEYFCDGMTENIILNLARSKALLVIARNSTFAYKNKSINVQQIGQELGARYLIEGSIQKINNLIRISVQLIDTESGHHIWSESYDRTVKDFFKLQDEITLEVLKAVDIKLTSPWGARSLSMDGVSDVESYIKSVGKYIEYMMNPKKEGYASALESAQEILDLNPEYLGRYDKLALVYYYGAFFGHCESSKICIFKVIETVKKSLSLDKTNAIPHMIMGWIFLVKKEYDNAMASFKKSIELDSLASVSYWSLGAALNYADKPEQALESLKIAFRLNPVPPVGFLNTLAQSYIMLEQYEKAIKILNRCLERQPDYWITYLFLAGTYSYLDQEENAKTMIIQLLNLVPDFSIEKFKNIALYKNQTRIERIIQALRKAGLPES